MCANIALAHDGIGNQTARNVFGGEKEAEVVRNKAANGVTAQYTYYEGNTMHALANVRGGTYLSSFNYAYDGNGNMVAAHEMKS